MSYDMLWQNKERLPGERESCLEGRIYIVWAYTIIYKEEEHV